MTPICAYEGCEYDEQSHRPYARKRDGIPSVSTISGALDTGKSRSFAWAAALAAATTAVHETPRWWSLPTHLPNGPCEHTPRALCPCCRFIRSEFDRQWKEKATLGSHVHHLALQWAKGEDAEVDEACTPYMDALEKFHVECAPEFTALEQTVLHEGSYRGQFDFTAWLTRPPSSPFAGTGFTGQRTLGMWDIKTGGFHPIEMTLQLAAYRYATWLTTWDERTEIKAGHNPVVDEAGVLMLGRDGNYELIVLPADRKAFEAFMSLRHGWGFAQGVEKWNKARMKEMEV